MGAGQDEGDGMKITAYPLYEGAATLRPAPRERGESLGFELLCPHAFTATWNGGPRAEDIEIQGAAQPRDFVQSREGEGRITFHSGYQFKTGSGQALWARGPVNAPKDGIAPLETTVDSSVLPCTLTLCWKFTRPGQTVRFEAGEPFCTVLPCPMAGPELAVVSPGDAIACEYDFEQMIEAPAMEEVLRRLRPPAAESVQQAPQAGSEEDPFPPPFHVIPPPRPLPAERLDLLFRGDHPARISVILPATNESVMLRRTVEQFQATLPANSEILVIDNGSTDGCADFLLEGDHEGVHLIRTDRPLGVAAARNLGLAQARGEVVVFADAHIDLPADWWQPLVDTLNRPNAGVAAPGIGVMGKPDGGVGYGQRIAETKLRLAWLSRKGEEPYPVPTLGGGFMAMRHDTLKRAGAFDEGMPQWGSEDVELCLRYWLLGYEVWMVPDVIVRHYFRNQRPYGVDGRLMLHNQVRVALLHFNQARLGRVLTAFRSNPLFGLALAVAAESDVWEKRAEFAARRVRDDDWLFERFSDCHV
jgi:glycosyltransferase involved in cell wall biosynthesis